jgi:type I restriction enzyme, S subunit
LRGLEVTEIKLSELEFSSRIDSEYYRKEFLHYETIVKTHLHSELKHIATFLIGPFGSSFDTDHYITNGIYRYVRGQDVKPFILKDGENRYIPKDDFERLSKYSLKEDDILISVVGTLGNACIVQKKDLPAIFSCKSTVIRAHKINPVFLLSYFNCKYGRDLLLRKQRGAIQKGLNLDDLKTAVVPILNTNFQNKIESIFWKAQGKLEKSKNLYSDAEKSLLSDLNLLNWKPSEENIAIKKFSQSYALNLRLDAEYYQLKFDELIKKLTAIPHQSLGNLVSIYKSIEPGSDAYQTEGIPFIRVSDVSKFEISQPEYHLNREIFEVEELKPKKDTILFSKDGSVGIAHKVEQDLDVITSSALLHLKIINKEVLPDYLTLVLNSKLVQMQAERDAGGSVIQHWRPDEIKQILLPILPMKKQKEISSHMQESFALRHQSAQLLETAKRAVEIAIEETENVAIDFLNNKTK